MVDSLLVTTSPTVYLTLEQSVCGRFPASHYKSYLTLEQNVCGTFPASHYKSYCVFDIRTECMW